jgi:hypothetical protein
MLIDLSCCLAYFSLNLEYFFHSLRRDYVALPMNASAFARGMAILAKASVEKALPPVVGTGFCRIPLQSTKSQSHLTVFRFFRHQPTCSRMQLHLKVSQNSFVSEWGD